MHQIVQGFQYLHREGILHGDIKLENILVGMDGRLKVADFGTSVQSQTLKRSTFCGEENDNY
jgi:serine/threonine protein kinase